MQVLIRFSQAERSTPAKVAPAKPKNEAGQTSEPERQQNKQDWNVPIFLVTELRKSEVIRFVKLGDTCSFFFFLQMFIKPSLYFVFKIMPSQFVQQTV